jgi:hypothetical protein
MPDQIYIGNFRKGLNDATTAFNQDNDSFTYLFNMYVWRGRALRKRGTVKLGRLERQIESSIHANITGATNAASAVLTANNTFVNGQTIQISGVSGMTQLNGNTYTITAVSSTTITINVNSTAFGVYSGGGIAFGVSLQKSYDYGPITVTNSAGNGIGNLLNFVSATSGASLVPGSITIAYKGNVYTDNSSTGVLTGTPSGSGQINYASGAFTLIGAGAGTAYVFFDYFPGLPVMGERDFTSSTSFSNYPLLIAFDTTYSYQCNQVAVNASFYSVSYYKTTGNPVVWTGQDYQQFWSTNYPSTTVNQSGAFWATNNVPGFHGYTISAITAANPTVITTTTNPNNVQTGDQVWFNNITGADAALINQLVFTATRTGATTFTIPVDTSAATINNSGLVQLLTNSVAGQDGIRWYDGDPTGGTGIPTVAPATGWVNFAPPLTGTSVSINGLPSDLYYLVGALAIVPYKDRLLFFSPYVQISPSTTPIQLQDTVIWSWNGTPFYNSLVPNNQTFAVNAYYVDQTGLGGYLPAGISQPIQTVTNNEDVLLVGFGGNGRKTRFAYTGNDFQPFLFYNINSELPSTSTFSSVVLDKGAIDIGSFGICITDQQSAQRIDLDIPNSVFQIQKNNNGAQRVNAIRDYINEWITFSYPVDDSRWKFPTQSFFFNYRDNTWAVFYENYTCKGNYRANDTVTWATLPYSSWDQWTDPWNTGTETDYEIQVIAGNPQGYVIIQSVGTGECLSGSISALANDGNGNTQVTSYNHCLQSLNPNTSAPDFIYIEGCVGTNSSTLNNKVYSVLKIIDANNFVINSLFVANDYVGGGEFRRLSQPFLQTRQFPFYWEQGRQVRVGVQKYLMDKTYSGQVTLNIYLSQDADDPWNNRIYAGEPNGLIYTQILHTCLESTNIGLTPSNVNLQTLVGQGMQQIWHRVNTSLQGDTFQIGITLSQEQMLDFDLAQDEIVLHGMQFTVSPGPMTS